MNKKIGNTFNPYALGSAMHENLAFQMLLDNNRRAVRTVPCGPFLLACALCLAYSLHLMVQGHRQESAIWLCALGVIWGTAIHMRRAHDHVIMHDKSLHFFGVFFYTSVTTILACLVYPTNPWLISACLVACIGIHAHTGKNVFRSVLLGAQPPLATTQRNQTLAVAVLGLVLVALTPTPLGWLSIVGLAALLCLHGWRLWFCFRGIELHSQQHADIWPAALNNPSTSTQAWTALTRYVACETIGRQALQDVVREVSDPNALLAYFEPFHTGAPRPAYMVQLVQERLCACDPNASMVFSMEPDPHKAARILAKMRGGEQEVAETLALPDLDENSHAA